MGKSSWRSKGQFRQDATIRRMNAIFAGSGARLCYLPFVPKPCDKLSRIQFDLRDRFPLMYTPR
jgi:hypothetical protein